MHERLTKARFKDVPTWVEFWMGWNKHACPGFWTKLLGINRYNFTPHGQLKYNH